jgi:DNA-binding XRE family transcriptional regulator
LEAKFIQPHRPGFLDIDDVVESLTQKHNLSSEMAAARREFAQANFSLDAMAVSRLRGLAGLSQAELARRTGIAQPHISRIENGMVDPSTDTIAQLANAMNVTADELFHAVRTVRQSKAGAHDDQ